ncbi:hypothetical protein J2W15_001882 [Pseudarthrobacter sulfonivorans]|nr:hypothetical protein [Pseudarthrobacter sulfonivorans]MDP9998383.1 hypothetical protein [Pseudarthrobacter sulfonivorans]
MENVQTGCPFVLYDEWFQDDDFEACSFVKVLLEIGAGHSLGRASIVYLGRIRQQVRILAMRLAWWTLRNSPSPGTSL